jgi:hypothetical protein
VLADLALRRLRSKIPAPTEVHDRPVQRAPAFLARMHLDLIDRHTEAINPLTCAEVDAHLPLACVCPSWVANDVAQFMQDLLRDDASYASLVASGPRR